MKRINDKNNQVQSMLSSERGFTLAEVMVAFVILLLASQLLLAGAAAARKMEARANELSAIGDRMEEIMKDGSNGISGTVRLKLDHETELREEGWLYPYVGE